MKRRLASSRQHGVTRRRVVTPVLRGRRASRGHAVVVVLSSVTLPATSLRPRAHTAAELWYKVDIPWLGKLGYGDMNGIPIARIGNACGKRGIEMLKV